MSFKTLRIKLLTQRFNVEFDSSNGVHELSCETREGLEAFLAAVVLDSPERLAAIQWDPGHAVLRLEKRFEVRFVMAAMCTLGTEEG